MEMLIIGSALRKVCGDQKALGLTFIREARTAPNYRLYEVKRQFTALVEVEEGGVSILGELCDLSQENYEKLLIDDGTRTLCAVSSFATLPSHATDISEHGGFVAYLESLKTQP